jgi:hypothetical protein
VCRDERDSMLPGQRRHDLQTSHPSASR